MRDRHQGSALRPDERAEEPDAGADPELRRDQQSERRLSAGHRRRRRPEPLHAVGQPLVSRSSTRTGRLRRRSCTGTRCSPASRTAESPAATAATRSSSTTSSRTAGSRSQLAYPNYPERALLPVRRGLADGRPDGYLVRLRVRRAPDQAQRLSEVRRLADPERVHGHGQPVRGARRQLGRRRRLRARARPDDHLRRRSDDLQGHVHRSSRTSGAACSRPTSTARRCRLRTRLRR